MDRKGTQLRAKFARFKPEFVWKPATDEARRHPFAMGTCAGCHAAETGTVGFQIQPSLAGESAALSAFLSTTVTVKPNGTPFTYNEPARRMNLVDQFLRGVDVPGDVFHHLECADIDACKPQD